MSTDRFRILTGLDGVPAGMVDVDLIEARARALSSSVAAALDDETVRRACEALETLGELERSLATRLALAALSDVINGLVDQLGGFASVRRRLALRQAEVDAYEALADLLAEVDQ